VITGGASSFRIGHAQGACFAAAMILAGVEARRYKKPLAAAVNPLQWASAISTEHLNQAVAQAVLQREFRVEPCAPLETELGFGVRAVNSGRTMVFETARWQESVIDVPHVQTTEENRIKVAAARAIIVGAGNPDPEARIFARAHPVSFLCGKELKELFDLEKSMVDKAGTAQPPKLSFLSGALSFFPRLVRRCRPAAASSRRSKTKKRRAGWMI
jgi:hypothetical protein